MKILIIIVFLTVNWTFKTPEQSILNLVEVGKLRAVEAKINNKRVLLLLDTGSSKTHISKTSTKRLGVEYRKTNSVTQGLGNSLDMYKTKTFILTLGKLNYEVAGGVLGMNNLINNIFEAKGVIIHGILGGEFLIENKCIINYNLNKLICNENR